MKDEVGSQNLRGERREQLGLDSEAWLFNENMTEPQSLPASRDSPRNGEVNKRQRRGGTWGEDGGGGGRRAGRGGVGKGGEEEDKEEELARGDGEAGNLRFRYYSCNDSPDWRRDSHSVSTVCWR